MGSLLGKNVGWGVELGEGGVGFVGVYPYFFGSGVYFFGGGGEVGSLGGAYCDGGGAKGGSLGGACGFLQHKLMHPS